MKLQFDADQRFQLDAIQAAVDLFIGQPQGSEFVASPYETRATSLELNETGIANRRVIANEQWLANLRTVQARNGLPLSERLLALQDDKGEDIGGFPNFSVEMETGTGKTYVYLRTIHELHRAYGFRKFVIVVPSVAIREGVMKSVEITREHLRALYDCPRVECSLYDAARVTQLRNFALSDALQILVINIDAFAKDSDESGGTRRKGNVINQVRETGVRPIQFIQNCRPIVILDEPQNLETDNRKQAIARLNPLCTLRYSATHREAYNLIYKLDPVRAYELGLVKQISVDSVLDETTRNQAYIDVEGFSSSSRSISAKASIWVNQAGGPKKKRVTLKNGSDLFVLSNQREIYRDCYIVNEIDAAEGVVRFANDVTARIGIAHGALTERVLRLQIEATIKRHFEKARKLEPMGIKVLSVFFIDRVSSYRVYHPDGSVTLGPFGRWFEDIYAQYRGKEDFEGLYDFDAESVHNGYFSKDKRSISPFGESSARTGAEAETQAFELIMRDKERLLDPAEPLRFIFSHSALREGWDNPNVFQICTLAESSSEIKKRQEIGRGLRLCVDSDGKRVFDRAINRLTVIANESYEDFAQQLQAEMTEAGVAFRKEMVRNERDTVKLALRKGYQADERFLALWERIKTRTRYRVQYDVNALVRDAAQTLREQMPKLAAPKLVLTRAELSIAEPGVTATQTSYRTIDVDLRYFMPDLLADVQALTGLARATIARILADSGRLQDAINNPQAFVEQAADLINACKRELLVQGVSYRQIGGLTYDCRRFEAADLSTEFASNVHVVQKLGKTLFSHIVIDSNSAPERQFAADCEANDDVLFYLKLPRWFTIETPVGPYNPDWALMYQNDDQLYFVAETKSAKNGRVDIDLLRPLERLKIKCGEKHFREFTEVRFKSVGSLTELLK
ncbi:MAG: DEAD/DEAH box helicase family protein [Gammaproteobacteria bacterium]|nr:DEAD/DEAH box helicase family protein [Gammaproteobacteria bacterium]